MVVLIVKDVLKHDELWNTDFADEGEAVASATVANPVMKLAAAGLTATFPPVIEEPVTFVIPVLASTT